MTTEQPHKKRGPRKATEKGGGSKELVLCHDLVNLFVDFNIYNAYVTKGISYRQPKFEC